MIFQHSSCNTFGVDSFSGDQPIVKGTTMRKSTPLLVLFFALLSVASQAFGQSFDSTITSAVPLAATAPSINHSLGV